MRRGAALAGLVVAAGVLPSGAAAAAPTAPAGVTVAKFKVRGVLKVKVAPDAPGPLTFTLLAYKRLDAPAQFPQTLTAAKSKTIAPGGVATLHVDAMDCSQIDGIVGAVYPTRLDHAGLQQVLLPGSYSYNTVTEACVPLP